MKLTAVFEKAPEGYIGFVEELPGANTQGDTLDEVRRNLPEAVEIVLAANRALGGNASGQRHYSRAVAATGGMRRLDLVRLLQSHGCELLREGGNHSVFINHTIRKSATFPRDQRISGSQKYAKTLKSSNPRGSIYLTTEVSLSDCSKTRQ